MEKVKDTCNTKCKFWKKYEEGCPFYMETVWSPPEDAADATPVIVKDCAPKRSVLLQMATNNQLIGLQKANEEYRNRQAENTLGLTALLQTLSDNPMIANDGDAEVIKIENLNK